MALSRRIEELRAAWGAWQEGEGALNSFVFAFATQASKIQCSYCSRRCVPVSEIPATLGIRDTAAGRTQRLPLLDCAKAVVLLSSCDGRGTVQHAGRSVRCAMNPISPQ